MERESGLSCEPKPEPDAPFEVVGRDREGESLIFFDADVGEGER